LPQQPIKSEQDSRMKTCSHFAGPDPQLRILMDVFRNSNCPRKAFTVTSASMKLSLDRCLAVFMNGFAERRVPAVLCSHDHNYPRNHRQNVLSALIILAQYPSGPFAGHTSSRAQPLGRTLNLRCARIQRAFGKRTPCKAGAAVLDRSRSLKDMHISIPGITSAGQV